MITNNRGTVNRVSYRPDDDPTPGWYAYLRTPGLRAAGVGMAGQALQMVQFVHPRL